ncbi:MAG: hypothetical protein IJU77_03890 [Butyrivibrio sp.]|nr:hypothetical protein [Butyrivibrio sp.]
MVTTVKLQDPFEYSWYVTLIVSSLLLLALGLLIYAIYRAVTSWQRAQAQRPRAIKIQMTPQMLLKVKEQYARKVMNIAGKYQNSLISKRDGYQELSLVIRGFVHEVTGINVENFTAKEVKAMGIRKLDVLMEEYYVPEFAEDEKAEAKDLLTSCNVATGVIKSWS